MAEVIENLSNFPSRVNHQILIQYPCDKIHLDKYEYKI